RQNYLYDIYIQRDNDFKDKYNFPGEGTLENPYIIENLIMSTDKINAIRIEDVTSCFTIRNCTLILTSSVKNHDQDVYLIYIASWQSPKVTIANNTICAPFYQPDYFIIYYLNGIYIGGCENVLIENNIFSNLDESLIMYNIETSIIVNNYCNDIFIIGFHIMSCTDALIENNTLLNCDRSTLIMDSSGIDIINNNISFCVNLGLEIYYSDFISIFNNNLNNNTIGVLILNSENINITKNWLKFNSEYGISIENQYNENITLYHNYFLNNFYINSSSSQAFDECNSTWYSIDLFEGNYWSDYIWAPDTVYYIDGGENFDPYPMELL
ncbi:MAG: nitrous oxide reductase family maturation protein NosD, partial [Candidatus Thorarchaeota archaeon]